MSLSKSAIIEKAKKLVLKGKIKQAIAEWKKLAAETPNDGNIYNAIGDLYLKSKDKPNATSAFIKAADAFQSATFELKSIALYKKALKVDPSKIEIHEKLAAVYAERGLIGNAIDDYLKAAKYYYKNGNFRAALSVYRKLSNLDPENVNIRLEIADMCEKQSVNEEAIEEYKKVVALYDAKNMASEAKTIREKLTALDPTYASQQRSAQEETSETGSKNKDTLEDKAVSENKEVATSAQAEDRSSEPESAEESAQEFLVPEAEPLALEQTVFPSSAHTILDESSSEHSPKKEPNSAHFENALTEAEVYIQYGLIDKAIDQIKSLATSFPSELKPHLKLKEIYTQQGMTQEAIETCHFLLKHYDASGDESAKKEILTELEALGARDAKPARPSDTPPPLETKSNASYFDDEQTGETSAEEPDPFGEAILDADSLSEDASGEPTLAALEEMASDEQNTQKTTQDSSKPEQKDPLQALNPTHENDEYVDLNSILSEGFGGDAEEIESSLERSFRDLQDVHGEQVGEETETQYDLGIAYKEMGMLAEAMKAFEMAALGQSRFQDAIIMLASCHREEGSMPAAAEVLENALAKQKDAGDTGIALKYELALLYEKLGDKRFEGLYQEIFDVDPSFRDIVKKCSDLTSKGQNNTQEATEQKPSTPNKQTTRDHVSHL